MSFRLGLRLRIVVFMAGVLALALIANATIVTPRVKSSIRAEQEQRIDQLAGTVGREIRGRLDAAQRELEAIATLPAVRSMDAARIDEILANLDRVTQSFLYFTVLDDRGVVLSRPSKPERVGADRSMRPYFQIVRRTGASSIVEPSRSTAGNRSLVAATPILSEDGQTIGVLTGALGLMDRNRDLYEPITRTSTRSWPVQLFLLSREGSVIAGSHMLGKPTELGISRPPEFETGDPGSTTVTDVGGRWVVASHELDALGWTVVARVPEDLVVQRTAEVSRPYTLAAFIVTTVAVALALLLASFMMRPLARLSRALTDYGRGSERKSLPESGAREISEVAKAFNRMLDERQALELQLRQSQKLQTMGTFAGGIAHDFNNLLTPIVLGASALAAHHGPDSSMGSLAADMELCANRARDLIGRLLAFSRQTKPQRTPVDLAHQVDDALRLASFHIPGNVKLHSELEEDCVILGDPIQVQQVVLNLVTNAVDAMGDAGGALDVSVRQSDDDDAAIVLEVSDTGPGMAPEVVARIFEPFYTTKDAGSGTGLGLSIVQGIVRDLGGRIEVNSESGHGTTFLVTLPLHDESVADEPALAPLPQTSSHRLLVVDDERIVARALAATLEDLGFRVDIAMDPGDAVDLVVDRGERFDLILTDQSMPGMSGIEMATRIREAVPEQRFLMISGSIDQANIDRCHELGIDHILAKPVSAADLERSVRVALGDD